MTVPVEAVLLDVDGTICDYRRSAEDILAVAFERVGVDPFFDEREYLERYADHTEAGDDIRAIRAACFAAIAADAGHDTAVGRAIAETFAEERDHTNVDFLPGAREAIDALDEAYPLGVVTNGDPWMQSQKLAGLDVADRFETVVHAGYDAAAKPDPEPFHQALDGLGVDGGRAVHVGNSLLADVPGAQAAGLEAVWLDDGSEHEGVPDYVVESMHELTDPPW